MIWCSRRDAHLAKRVAPRSWGGGGVACERLVRVRAEELRCESSAGLRVSPKRACQPCDAHAAGAGAMSEAVREPADAARR